jgi:hypothetical protein
MPQAVADWLQGHGLQATPVAAGTVLEVEVPVMQQPVAEPGPAILEAQASTHWTASHQRTQRALPEGWCVVATGQRYGAIAVVACEAESDDGVIANGIVAEPVAGAELPVWRVLAPV